MGALPVLRARSGGKGGVSEPLPPSAARLRSGLRFVPAHRLIPAPHRGMKYLPRDMPFAKLQALVAGTALR